MRITINEVLRAHPFRVSQNGCYGPGITCKWMGVPGSDGTQMRNQHAIHVEQELSKAGIYDWQDEFEELRGQMEKVQAALERLTIRHDYLEGLRDQDTSVNTLMSVTNQIVAYQDAIRLLKAALR